jgi:hypothetical protein
VDPVPHPLTTKPQRRSRNPTCCVKIKKLEKLSRSNKGQQNHRSTIDSNKLSRFKTLHQSKLYGTSRRSDESSVSCLFCEYRYIFHAGMSIQVLYKTDALLFTICACYSCDMALTLASIYHSITCRAGEEYGRKQTRLIARKIV